MTSREQIRELVNAIDRWNGLMRDDHTLCKAANAALPALRAYLSAVPQTEPEIARLREQVRALLVVKAAADNAINGSSDDADDNVVVPLKAAQAVNIAIGDYGKLLVAQSQAVPQTEPREATYGIVREMTPAEKAALQEAMESQPLGRLEAAPQERAIPREPERCTRGRPCGSQDCTWPDCLAAQAQDMAAPTMLCKTPEEVDAALKWIEQQPPLSAKGEGMSDSMKSPPPESNSTIAQTAGHRIPAAARNCDCRVCRRADQLQAIALLLPEYYEFIESIDGDLESAETEAVYWRMKYEGTWPGDELHESPAASPTDADSPTGNADQIS